MSVDVAPLLDYLRRLAVRPAREGTDAELLDRWVCQREEAAFTALVGRHGPMVLRVCARLMRDSQMAEDCFQAVFLVLARKAAAVRPPHALAAFLHGVARRVALKARAAEWRRLSREKRAPIVAQATADPLDALTARELLDLLDEEVRRLPQAYRLPVILCCLEGRTIGEAADLLGWSPGSLRGRLLRGRSRLQTRLARRGLSLPAALLAAGIGTTAAPSAGLLAATVRSAIAFAIARGSAAGVPMTLASAVLRGMLVTRLTSVGVLLASLVLAGAGALLAFAESPPATGETPPQILPTSSSQRGETPPAPRVDRFGDALPPGALFRLGTVRLRHSSSISALAVSPDGRFIASASIHGEMRLWDRATGRLVREFAGSSGGMILWVVFSPDGKLLLADRDRLVLWDVATGERRRELSAAYRKFVQALAFTPDGHTVAVAPQDEKGVELFSVATGKRRGKIEVGDSPVQIIAYSPDGKYLATGLKDGEVRIWQTEPHKAVGRFSITEKIIDLVWSPDGKALATATSEGNGVQVWRVADAKQLHVFAQDHGNSMRRLAFSPDGKHLACAGMIFDLSTGKLLGKVQEYCNATAFTPDGKEMVTAGADGVVRIHDATTAKERAWPVAKCSGSAVHWVAFSPRGDRVFTWNYGRVSIWDTTTGRQLRHIDIDAINNTAMAPPARILAAVGSLPSGSIGVRLFNTATGEELRTLSLPRETPIRNWSAAVALSPDERLVASTGTGKDVRVWEVRTGRLVQTLRGHQDGVYALAFTSGGKQLLSASLDQTIRFWDVDKGQEQRSALKTPEHLQAISADGHLLALSVMGPTQSSLHVRQSDDREILRLDGIGVYGKCAFSPDGRLLAVQDKFDWAPGRDSTIAVVELATGQVRQRFRLHAKFVMSLAFSPDGRLLASGCGDTTALLWDLMGALDKKEPADLAKLWDALKDEDAAHAYRAMKMLLHNPAPSLTWLRTHLPPIRPVDVEKAAPLIRDLEATEFPTREKASAELEKLGEVALPSLHKALRDRPSLETRRRVEQVLEKVEVRRSPNRLRSLRAVEVLERIGTPEARTILESLAAGVPGSWRTDEAQATRKRLGH